MVGRVIRFLAQAQPIEGPLADMKEFFNKTLPLVYQRGLFDGFVAGVLITLLCIIRFRGFKR